MCLSSVSGAPTANRNVYLSDKTCIFVQLSMDNEVIQEIIAIKVAHEENVVVD